MAAPISPISHFFATAELDPMLSEYPFDAGIEGADYLDEITNPFETINPEHSEHQPGFPWADFENSTSQPTYTENCPYNKKETFGDFSIAHKKFRLVEEFPEYEPFPENWKTDWLTYCSGLEYTGDSYGSHSYIDASEERACPQSCFCWSHGHAPGVFTFIAHKSSSQLVVDIYSDALYSEVIQAISPEKVVEEESIDQGDPQKSLNGFYLLQSFGNLRAHLNLLHSYPFDQTLSHVISEMELLVHGFLADGDVFKSFGYEHLYENGYLTFEQWKSFQQDQFQRDISTLDKRFTAIDESNDLDDFEYSPDYAELFSTQSENFEDVETQRDENPMHSSQSAQCCIEELNAQKGDNPKFKSENNILWDEFFQKTLDRELLSAIDSGREEAVREILDQGAAVNGVAQWYRIKTVPLAKAAYAGHEKIVELLLDRGALDSDLALINAAGAGHEAVVNLLLSHDHGTNDSLKKNFCYVATKFLDFHFNLILRRSESQDGGAATFSMLSPKSVMSHISSDWVGENAERHFSEARGVVVANDIALIEAAAAGHEEVVKVLLDSGAKLRGADTLHVAATHPHTVYNYLVFTGVSYSMLFFSIQEDKDTAWTGERRVPVVEAAKAGHGAVMRILLERGALVSSLRALMSPCITTKENSTSRRLNKKFIQQYRLMMEVTLDSSADFSQFSTRFKNHREAWSAGISTMRRLCNGKPPRGLQNAAAFLCISRAMSETLDSTNGTDYISQFLEDLERWQVIFTSKELEVYRQLIHSMWGSVLSENTSKSWKPSDFLTLTHFQALLSTFIRQSNEPFNLYGPHDQSLRCSQQSFLARNHYTLGEPKIDLPTTDLDSSDESGPEPPDGIEPKPPDIPIAPQRISLKEHIDNDISAASLNATVVLIMAGAIFAIVVIFLQCTSLIFLSQISPSTNKHFCAIGMRDSSHGCSYNTKLHDLKDRCQVLTAYLGLKVGSAAPSVSSIATRSMDLINMLSSLDQLDKSKETETAVNPLGDSSLLQFSGHSSQFMVSPEEPEVSQQVALPSLQASAVCKIPPSNSTHSTATPSSDSSTQLSTSTQQSIPISTKPSQKLR